MENRRAATGRLSRCAEEGAFLLAANLHVVNLRNCLRGEFVGRRVPAGGTTVFYVEDGYGYPVLDPGKDLPYCGFRYPDDVRWKDGRAFPMFHALNHPFSPWLDAAIRKRTLLAPIDVRESVGLEIGPLASPIVMKAEGRVYYADHLPTEELVAKYAHDPNVDVSRIVPVDFVWGDRPLRQAVPAGLSFDYAVASHVIEHVPDLIGWLNELADVLKGGGVVSLAVPDKRYTFDYFRPLSTLGDLIDAHLNRLRRPGPKAIVDHCAYAADIDVFRAWLDGFDASGAARHHRPEDGLYFARESVEQGKYVDVHCWIFTYPSFLHLIGELRRLGLIRFDVLGGREPLRYSNEFFVTLRRAG